MPAPINRTGQRYGKLTVLRRDSTDPKQASWLCRCDCGTEKIISGTSLQSGNTRSCGCLKLEYQAKVKELAEARHLGLDADQIHELENAMKRKRRKPNKPRKQPRYTHFPDRTQADRDAHYARVRAAAGLPPINKQET